MGATKVIRYEHDRVYALEQSMVRSLLIIGDEKALLFDAGVEEDDLMGIVRGLTDLPLVFCLSHSDRDHIENVSQFGTVYLHKDEEERFRKTGKAEGLELITVEEGHVFDLGGRSLRVIACPGHTPGSISLLDAGNGILFSGDTVSYGPVYMFGDGRDMDAYIATLEKLKALYDKGDFADVYPCHNVCPIDGACIEELIHCAKDLMAGVLEGVPATMTAPGGAPVMEYHVGDCGIYHI